MRVGQLLRNFESTRVLGIRASLCGPRLERAPEGPAPAAPLASGDRKNPIIAIITTGTLNFLLSVRRWESLCLFGILWLLLFCQQNSGHPLDTGIYTKCGKTPYLGDMVL